MGRVGDGIIGALYEQGSCRSQREIPHRRRPSNPTLQKTKGGALGCPGTLLLPSSISAQCHVRGLFASIQFPIKPVSIRNKGVNKRDCVLHARYGRTIPAYATTVSDGPILPDVFQEVF